MQHRTSTINHFFISCLCTFRRPAHGGRRSPLRWVTLLKLCLLCVPAALMSCGMSNHTAPLSNSEARFLGARELKPVVTTSTSAASPAAAAAASAGGTRMRLREPAKQTQRAATNPTPTRQVQGHHFPLYSHPMFRAAARNSAAVRSALDAQLSRVDSAALDAAVEKMVEEMLLQQQQRGGAMGDVEMSEAQVLAVLASASHAAPSPPPRTATYATTPSPGMASASPATVEEDNTFAVTSGLRTRPLPPTTIHRHDADVPTARYVAASSAAADDDDVQVVSVHALQRAALAHTRQVSKGVDTSHTTSSPYVSSIPHGSTSATGGSESRVSVPSPSPPTALASPAATAAAAVATPVGDMGGSSVGPAVSQTRQQSIRFTTSPPPPQLMRSGLYSFLPITSTTAAAAAAPTGHEGNGQLSGRGEIPFTEMDRRPGRGTGPVAQQSVDTAHLNHVNNAVFAAMDVLMDGNSCCVRRRQRKPGHGTGPNASRSALGGLSVQGGYGYALSAPLRSSTVPPPPPPPRTAAEAKARRILDAQRRRQRPPDPVPASSDVVACNGGGYGNLESTRGGASSLPASLPPLPTMRGLATQSLLDQALLSAHQLNTPYR